jgi:DNA-binding response OmpR family regulator
MKDGKILVLYVDDDDDMLEAVRLRLDRAGYAVATAPSAEDGLKAFNAEKPDFVLVDLMMEEIDAGAQLVKQLKLAGNKAPVYMLSSMGDQLSVTTSYAELGLDGVLQKPIDFDMLLRTLKAKVG